MKLYEIAEGEPIQILASTGKNTFEHMTLVDIVKEGVIFVEPIRHGDKLLDFSGANLDISVVYVLNGEKPIVWEKCAIRYIQTKTQKFHAIICRKEGRRLNRRQAFRQYLGIRASLLIERTRKRRDVIIKNISTTGIAFVIEPNDMTMNDIGEFLIEFEDSAYKLNVHLYGKVVREEEIDEDKKVFGAILTRTNIDLNNYINVKQKQEIAKRRGSEMNNTRASRK